MDFGREERDGPPIYQASDGTPYTTITMSGPKPEGEPEPFILLVTSSDEDIPSATAAINVAMALLEGHIRNFLDKHPGVIEWRMRPQPHCHTREDRTFEVSAWCRLAVVKEAAAAPRRTRQGEVA